MKDLVIEGKADLEGTVAISGFKHSLAPILAACAFVDGQSTIRNVPHIEDSAVLCEIFSLLGAQIQRTGDSLTIDTQNLAWRAISDPLMARVHSSIYMIPCLLGRLGEVDLGPSGGCLLGDQDQPSRRPVHHILNVLEQFGARFNISEDRIRGRCSGFRCAHIDIRNYWTDKKVIAGPLASGATKTALLASAIAKGTSIIDSPYRKAEVEEMLAFFQSAGVAVEDRGSRLIIEGRPTLGSGNHALIPDLIEVVTFIACGLYLQRPIRLQIVADKRVRLGLAAELEVLESMGADLEWEEGVITVPQTGILKGVDIEVTPQSIYSDSHPLLALVLLSADRPARIVEKVWPQRFHYARELVKMGAQLHVKNGVLDITPQRPFRSGVQVHGGDLRSAAVLLLAALGIEGSTTLRGAEHIDRGYEDFVGKLEKLGARITSF